MIFILWEFPDDVCELHLTLLENCGEYCTFNNVLLTRMTINYWTGFFRLLSKSSLNANRRKPYRNSVQLLSSNPNLISTLKQQFVSRVCKRLWMDTESGTILQHDYVPKNEIDSRNERDKAIHQIFGGTSNARRNPNRQVVFGFGNVSIASRWSSKPDHFKLDWELAKGLSSAWTLLRLLQLRALPNFTMTSMVLLLLHWSSP